MSVVSIFVQKWHRVWRRIHSWSPDMFIWFKYVIFVDVQSDFLCPRSLKSVQRRLDSRMHIRTSFNRMTIARGGMPRYKTKAPNLDPYLNYLQKEYNSKYEMRTQKNVRIIKYKRSSKAELHQRFIPKILKFHFFQGEQVEKSSNVRSIWSCMTLKALEWTSNDQF